MWKLIDKFVAPAGLFLGVAMLTLGALLMPTQALADMNQTGEGSVLCILLCGGTCAPPQPCTGTCTGALCPSWCRCRPVMLGCLCN
jgi:hypothetical protein